MADRCIDTLITHSGSFHADDLLAHATLSALYPEARLLRTRDPLLIAATDATAIVFDVGFHCAPEVNRYDHHQPDRPQRPKGLAYSSFGLIWRHFGRAYIAEVLGLDEATSGETIGQIHAELDAGLLRDIDAVDNGELAAGQDALMHPLSLPNLFSTFCPAFDEDEPGIEDGAFREAAAVARRLLCAQVESTAAALRSSAIVTGAIASRTHPNWIELPRSMDYLEPILAAGSDMDADRIHFIIAPSRGEWQLKTVNVSADSFESRWPLPASWAGLRGPDLVAVTGISDAVFCHAGRFVAITRSRGGAMALLKQALES